MEDGLPHFGKWLVKGVTSHLNLDIPKLTLLRRFAKHGYEPLIKWDDPTSSKNCKKVRS